MPSINISSATTTQVTSQPGKLNKIIVNSHTSGSWKLINGTLTQTAIGGTYSPASGSGVYDLEPLGFDTGLCVVTAGTINLTLVYNENSNII